MGAPLQVHARRARSREASTPDLAIRSRISSGSAIVPGWSDSGDDGGTTATMVGKRHQVMGICSRGGRSAPRGATAVALI